MIPGWLYVPALLLVVAIVCSIVGLAADVTHRRRVASASWAVVEAILLILGAVAVFAVSALVVWLLLPVLPG